MNEVEKKLETLIREGLAVCAERGGKICSKNWTGGENCFCPIKWAAVAKGYNSDNTAASCQENIQETVVTLLLADVHSSASEVDWETSVTMVWNFIDTFDMCRINPIWAPLCEEIKSRPDYSIE